MTKRLILTLLSFTLFGLYTELQFTISSELFQTSSNSSSNSPSEIQYEGMLTVGIFLGFLLTFLFILPLMNDKGRKFLNVHIRFLLGSGCAVTQIGSFYLHSSELQFVSQIFLGMSLAIATVTPSIFIGECASVEERGMMVAVLQTSTIVSSVLINFLFHPYVLGNQYLYSYISITSLILAILLFSSTYHIPESPIWLVRNHRYEEAVHSLQFYQGENINKDVSLASLTIEADFLSKGGLNNFFLNKITIHSFWIVSSVCLFILFSPTFIEERYFTIIHSKLGLTEQQSLTINLLIHLLFFPLRFAGVILLDKYGRRLTFFLAFMISFSKLSIMIIAHVIIELSGASSLTVCLAMFNELLTELYISTGILALPKLLIVELFFFPSRSIMTQIVVLLSVLPTLSNHLFPYIYEDNSVSYFLFCLIIQLFIFYYLFKNLPETKCRSISNILNELKEKVYLTIEPEDELLFIAPLPSYSSLF